MVRLTVSSTFKTRTVPDTHHQGGSPLQILVVDNDADSLYLFKVMLEKAGAVVTVATSAPKALQVMLHTRFDLLISDIAMPEMDGYDLIRQVRALPVQGNQRVPAISVTGYADEAHKAQAIAAGFQAHLAKPVEPSHLLAAVKALAAPRAASSLCKSGL